MEEITPNTILVEPSNEETAPPSEPKLSWAELKNCFWICPQCRLCMRTPKVLPCMHNLCLECFENYVLQKHAVSAGRFKCPVCATQTVFPQKGVMAFATNIYMEQLQQNKRHLIDKFGDRSLEGCSCNLCTEYRNIRNRIIKEEESRKETLLASEKSDADKKLDVPAKYQLQDCAFHLGETVLYFCVDCQQSACRLCVELRHRDHRFEPLVLAAENARSLLKTTQEILVVRQQSNSKFLKKMGTYAEDLKGQREKTLSDVDTYVQQMHEILDRVKERLVADVERIYSIESTAVSRLIDELELSQQQLSGVSGFLEAHKGHDPAELVQQRFLITDRINQLYAAEQRANFPMSISFYPAIPGMSKDEGWLNRAEVALKNSVGSIVSNRMVTNDFVRNQTAARGEINKAVMLASFTLTVPPQSNHEVIILAEKTRRQSVSGRPGATASESEVPLTRHVLPSISIDPFCYIFALDRSTGTVARFFGGSDIARRVYHFPPEKCRPLRICSVGSTSGFAYVDAVSPAPNIQAFSLRFVPRTGDRFDLILRLDRCLFAGGDSKISLLDKIPAICADANSNIYVLDINNAGTAVIIAYSMSFGSVKRIVLETKQQQLVKANETENKAVKHISVPIISGINSSMSNVTRDSIENEKEESELKLEPDPSPSKPVVSADFGSYLACCPHMTGTRDVVPSTVTTTCPGVFAVVDTLRDSVKLVDIFGKFVCDLVVPSPLEKIFHPRGVAFDYQGNLIVCDQGNNRLLLFDHSARRLRGVLAAGPPALEALRSPADVCAVPGRLQCYVAEETTAVAKLFDYTSLVAPHSLPSK